MSKKTDRLNIIRGLIESKDISSQEDMLALLKDMGIEATQSTLSRDIKELRAIKTPHPEKGYVYLLTETLQHETGQNKNESPVVDNILYIEFSGNIILVRTKPGYAKAVGVMIDGEDYDEVLGTLAGDDTLFILLVDGVNPVEFLPQFDSIHPNIKTLYSPKGRRNSPNYTKRKSF